MMTLVDILLVQQTLVPGASIFCGRRGWLWCCR